MKQSFILRNWGWIILACFVFMFAGIISYASWKESTMSSEERMVIKIAGLAQAESGDIVVLTNGVICIITAKTRSSMTLMTPTGIVTRDMNTVVDHTDRVIRANVTSGERIGSAAIGFAYQFRPGRQQIPAFP